MQARDNKEVKLNSEQVQQFVLKVLLRIFKWLPIDSKVTEERLKIILQIVLLASSGKQSIHHVCRRRKNTLSSVTVRNTIKMMFEETEELEKILNRLIKLTINRKILRGQPIVSTDIVLTEYYGDPEDPKEVRKGEKRNGTYTFHGFATVYINLKQQRYTLAVKYVWNDDTMLDTVKRLNRYMMRYGIKPKVWIMDKGYYSLKLIKWFKTHNKCALMPAKKSGRPVDSPKGPTSTNKFLTCKRSCKTQYTIKTSNKEFSLTRKRQFVTFNLVVVVIYPDGKENPSTKKVYLYVAIGLEHMRPKNIHRLYKQRFGIETSYRQTHQARIVTSSKSHVLRFFFLGVALVVRNVWIYLHFSILYQKRRGPSGRNIVIEKLPFITMLSWIEYSLSSVFTLITEIKIDNAFRLERLKL